MQLKPFFSFYGAKWGLAPHYPRPLNYLIVEPFAGSAGYSVRHFDNAVQLYDIDPVLVGVWKYLIGSTKKDILDLPIDFESTADLDIPQAAKHFLGFWIARGRSTPAITKSAWMRSGLYATSFWSKEKRDRVANQVQYIKHWRCDLLSYENIYNFKATWFLDPPYQSKGIHYKMNKIDYSHLGDWAKSLNGQVIVCENDGSDWLNFSPFRKLRGVKNGGKKMSYESICLLGDGASESYS